MNNVRTVSATAATAAVLIVIVGVFIWQSRTLNMVDIADLDLPEAKPELVVAGNADQQLIEAVNSTDIAKVESLLEAGASANALSASGDPVLMAAIVQGNAEIAKLLVEHGADVNGIDKDGNAILGKASYIGELEIARQMLDAGADANALMKTGSGPSTGINAPVLLEAVMGNNSEIVELLIAHGADVNQAEMYQDRTPLHGAAWFNNAEIVQILLDNGADPNAPSSFEEGETPLFFAVRNGSTEAAQALLDGGAEINFQTERGWSPLIALVNDKARQDMRSEMITFILGEGADPNLGDAIGNAALHHAARQGLAEAISILIENGATVDLQNNVGNTALHQAAKWNQIQAIEILLEHGASLDVKNDKDQTVLDVAIDDRVIELLRETDAGNQLHEAVRANDTAAVERLLEAGSSPNALDSSGDPILLSAIQDAETSGSTDIVALLVDKGADVNALDRRGNALLPLAAKDGQLEVVQLLLDAGADVDSPISDGRGTNDCGLARAAIHNHIEIAELLIAHGANVNHAESGNGYTVLISAAYFNNPEIIKILLDNGADPNLHCCPGFGGTALHGAADQGAIEAAQALLAGGADVNIQTDLGITPLMSVIMTETSTTLAEMVAVLLDGDADPNLQDVNGDSALHYAARLGYGHEDAIPILIEHGASLDLRNNNGETPLDIATSNTIIELLRDAGAD
jgi:ankyrin repeat protein